MRNDEMSRIKSENNTIYRRKKVHFVPNNTMTKMDEYCIIKRIEDKKSYKRKWVNGNGKTKGENQKQCD